MCWTWNANFYLLHCLYESDFWHTALLYLMWWLTGISCLSCLSVSFEHRTTSCFLSSALLACTTLFLSEVTVHCLLHGLVDTDPLIHSWCDIARNRVGTVIGRWRWHLGAPFSTRTYTVPGVPFVRIGVCLICENADTQNSPKQP